MPVFKWQDGGTPNSKWTGLCKSNLYLEFTALQWISVLLLTHVSTSTPLCACLWYVHHYSFLCIWRCKSNEISLAQTTLTIPVAYIKGCMLISDLAQWPPNQIIFSTLGYHWRDHVGRPLEPQVHWDATGKTLADASTQRCSSGDPVLICTIGTHRKTIGATSTLECHWNHTDRC